MMKHFAALGLAVLLPLAGACQQQQQERATNETTPAATSAAVDAKTALTPEQLGELGAQIRKEPARADELLAQHKLSRAEFEKQIRDVTENAEASKRYAEAYRKASA
jgi:hypothetical protein